jgi:hypothetical protein
MNDRANMLRSSRCSSIPKTNTTNFNSCHEEDSDDSDNCHNNLSTVQRHLYNYYPLDDEMSNRSSHCGSSSSVNETDYNENCCIFIDESND